MAGIFESAGYAAMEKGNELTPLYNPSEIISRTNKTNYHHNVYDGKSITENIIDDMKYARERRLERHSTANRLVRQTVKEKPDMSLYETLMYNPCLN
ncbi:hypothetical protein KY331_05315 [Candidatus Woesearchaeota archaeon]|nr:hypothetical protein [Candidatus Woesearchaeota archaeon]